MLGFRTRFWVNVAGRVVSIAVSLAFAIFATDPIAKWLVPVAAISVLVLVEYLGVYRPSQRFEEVVRKQFDFYFEPFIDAARSDGAEIRVNVMLAHWQISGRHFSQYYQMGMEGHPDANLRFSVKRGLCGHAFGKNSHEVVYRDLRNDTPEISRMKYQWTDEEFKKTKHLTAIATIPLYRQRKTLTGRLDHDYFGVLNFDATNDQGADFLADASVQEQIKGFAGFVQISLS